MYDNKVVQLQCFMLQHEEAHFPLNAFCLTLCGKAVDTFDLHGYAQAHDITFVYSYDPVAAYFILARGLFLSIKSVLILGIGNTLLSDEGIGVQLVNRMQRQVGAVPGIEYLDGGTLSFTLAEPIARADGLIVADAARMGEPPGTLRVFHDQEMDSYLQGNRASVHEVSLGDLLDIARLSDTLPARRCLIGIEPEHLDWGEALSKTVEPAVEQGIAEIVSILESWGLLPAG